MPVLELRRDIPRSLAGSSNLVTSLALKAEAFLGYSWLRRKLGIDPGTLANTLEELGIEPFRVEDIKKHKKEKARSAEREAYAEFKARARLDGFVGLGPGTYIQATWHTKPLKKYDGDVPEFALSHALEIKERMPNAEFEVEELRVAKRYDPLLVVSYGAERFYIDVWDEQDLEQSHRQEAETRSAE
jgi:hypothetical protein